VISEILRHVYS